MATKTISKLKAEMIFNSDLTRLVDSMKGVAAAQYHMMEHKRTNLDRFGSAVDELFSMYDFRRSRHPFIRSASPRKLIVLVATDSGFLGGLNMKVAQAGLKQEEKETHYLVIGERGVNFMKEFNRPYTALPGINTDDSRFELVEKVVEELRKRVLTREAGNVALVYPHAVSFTVQRIQTLNILPCPLFFKGKPENVPTQEEQDKEAILESNEADVIEYLTLPWLRKRLIEIFEDSKMAEFGARTMHLESSYQTLTKIDKQLKLQFFKTRREKIDQSLRESFTAQLICK